MMMEIFNQQMSQMHIGDHPDHDINIVNIISEQLWEFLLTNNTELKKFNETTKNSQKVRLLLKLLKENNLMNIEKFKCENCEKKNDEESKRLRKIGNELFSIGNFTKSIEFYNSSLLFAELNSENLGIAFANRSAICFELKKYYECLENITLAKENNYPLSLMEKLNKRKKKCDIAIFKNKIPLKLPNDYIPKLTYKAHAKVPFIVECLEIDQNETFGRFIKTNKDLKPGDLLVIEEPFCMRRSKVAKFNNCGYCLKESLSLIPCGNCTEIMFCNQECYAKGLNEFHRLECNLFQDDRFSELNNIALRIVLSLFSEPNNLPKLQKFVNEFDERNANVFTVDYTNNDLLNKYQSVYALERNNQKRSIQNIFEISLKTAIMFNLVERKQFLKIIFKKKTNETLFIELLFRHLQSSEINSFKLFLKKRKYMTVTYPFISLINHSCVPNIFTLDFEGKSFIYVRKPIKKGEQLFCCYGFDHLGSPLIKRQSFLKEKFYFQCKCIGCSNNYPLLEEIFTSPSVIIYIPEFILLNLFDEYQYVNKSNDTLKKYIKQYSHFLIKYNNLYPCKELITVETALILCCKLLGQPKKMP